MPVSLVEPARERSGLLSPLRWRWRLRGAGRGGHGAVRVNPVSLSWPGLLPEQDEQPWLHDWLRPWLQLLLCWLLVLRAPVTQDYPAVGMAWFIFLTSYQ